MLVDSPRPPFLGATTIFADFRLLSWLAIIFKMAKASHENLLCGVIRETPGKLFDIYMLPFVFPMNFSIFCYFEFMVLIREMRKKKRFDLSKLSSFRRLICDSRKSTTCYMPRGIDARTTRTYRVYTTEGTMEARIWYVPERFVKQHEKNNLQGKRTWSFPSIVFRFCV